VTDARAVRAQAGDVRWIEAAFGEAHVRDMFLVVAATDDPALNTVIGAGARRAGALVCDVSSANSSQVIFGALLTRDDATIAVFTDGRDPAHARHTRDRVAEFLAQDRKRS
jgi:uroporphyrin-III C-methyltransferase/precorrin-2 dehydrogenase/sirohydrochlorin ferrochelatase